MVEKVIVSLLLNDADVASVVGTKVFPDGSVPPGTSTPYITYQRRSANHISHLGGSSGRCDPTIQVDCYSSDYGEASQLREYVRLACQGWSGTAAGIVVQGTKVDNDYDDTIAAPDGRESVIQVCGTDVRPKAKEAIPA